MPVRFLKSTLTLSWLVLVIANLCSHVPTDNIISSFQKGGGGGGGGKASRPALGPTQPTIQCVSGSLPGAKAAGS
jgi:hypothetical protein